VFRTNETIACFSFRNAVTVWELIYSRPERDANSIFAKEMRTHLLPAAGGLRGGALQA
jgi:hypothetical protein